ncbi:centrosomal protein 43 isoform X2 [Gouania willdenowi]|uniref:centrosomal protein 43 isoform X2 n=1 Tax=Gouania willdenowi TaxID=441366 RepID=UPI001054EE9C|nr:FGFR1 oncogene partner isoform X2 [Gouania willdenowi]
MSAAEDDTELRDLLILNLENSGVLNKIKAEVRAAVFLAMEDQDRLQDRSPLTNQQLENCLRSTDGGLAVGLIQDFLQVFNLDFSLSVFQPEINRCVTDSRDVVCRDLRLSETNKNVPLLLEVVRRGRQRESSPTLFMEELSENRVVKARRVFERYDKNQSGSVLKEHLQNVFADLLPTVSRNMLETFINDELKTTDRSSTKVVDFQLFLQIYKHLFAQCRAVTDDDDHQPKEPIRKGSANKGAAAELSSVRAPSFRESLDLVDEDEGDPFFDDPLPKPQKTYGGKVELSRPLSGSEPGGGVSLSEQSHSRSRDLKRGATAAERPGLSHTHTHTHTHTGLVTNSFCFSDICFFTEEDVEYDDDFNSHRSDLSRSELSIGEEIEVSIEGPAHSEQDSTQDLSVSQLSHGADYMEEVS